MMPPSFILLVAISLGLGANLHAQAPAASPAAANLAKTSGKEYVLAHQSEFTAPPSNARNPFWPIGWVPSAALPAAAATLDVRAEQFVVTSISVDAPALAVINGRTRGVGDHIPVTADNRDYVTVKQILDGVVVLDYHGHDLRTMPGSGTKGR